MVLSTDYNLSHHFISIKMIHYCKCVHCGLVKYFFLLSIFYRNLSVDRLLVN